MNYLEKRYEVSCARDVRYGTATIGYNEGNGPVRERDLRMDVYTPRNAPTGARPALVLAFGGAFHRGSKADDAVRENGHANTPIADYCALFAARGYVCFSIDYRLTQEDPDPGTTRILGDEDVPRSRIDYVRSIMGLPPSTAAMILRVQEAGADDMAMAFRHVTGHAADYGVDPARVAVGGFSAGGRNALNAAFGENIQPLAAIALSAYVPDIVLDRYLQSEAAAIPVFAARGEHDLDYVCQQSAVMSERLTAAGAPHQLATVPDCGHFYPATASVQSSGGAAGTLEDAIAAFLQQVLRTGGNDGSN